MASTHERSARRKAEEVVRGVLPRSAEIRAGASAFHASLIVNDQALRLEWIGEGGLRQVRQLLGSEQGRPDIVVAGRFSPAAREALVNAGVGWADETGAAEIVVGPIVVSRAGRPSPPTDTATRWTPAVIGIAEALLCGTRGTVSTIQAATGLSAGACTHGLRILTDLGLLKANAARGRHSSRSIADRVALLDAYTLAAERLTPRVALQIGVTWRDPLAGLITTGEMWDKAGVAWAATGATAAAVIAPYLTAIGLTEVYLDVDTVVGLEAAAADVGLQPIEGGRLVLRTFPTVSVRRLANEVDGLRVSPWPRVYVDLRKTGVRGEEAAEHLLEALDA